MWNDNVQLITSFCAVALTENFDDRLGFLDKRNTGDNNKRNMKNIRIKDLYTGKPDAKDEVNFESPEKFIKTFVVADHFNLDSLTKGTNCFITGFKGTGKTALLF